MKWINKLTWYFCRQYQYLFYWLEWYFSDERKNPYCCTDCGSTDVEIKVWSKVNKGGRYSGDCEEFERSFCNHCQKYVRIRPTLNLLNDAQEWWKRIDYQKKGQLTGYCQAEFSPKNEYQNFAHTCDKWWHLLSTEDKIRIWLTEQM